MVDALDPTPLLPPPAAPRADALPRPVLVEQPPPIACEIVHAIDGRLRLRVPLLRRDPEFGRRAVAHLRRQRGVLGARMNAASASLIVSYDSATTTPGRIVAIVQREVPDTAVRGWEAPAASLAPLICGGLAIGLSLLGAPALLSTGLLAASAVPIAMRAVQGLVEERRVTADALDAAAVSVLALRGDAFAASLSASLIAGGEYIRALTARRSRGALTGLLGSAAQRVWVVRGTLRERVPAASLQPGDVVVIYPGELIAVDGTVIRGRGLVDQHVLTGESTPVLRRAGDPVFASTVLTDGKLYVATERVGGETRADRIVQTLETAPVHDTRIGNYARRLADRFVLPTLGLAAAIYLLTGDIARTVSVIVFDFATGVRVSVPTIVLATMNAGARRNLLIKGGRALEQAARVDCIVFDKTGTLTTGAPRVTAVRSLCDGYTSDDVLLLAAAVERRLKHPAAEAIVHAAEATGRRIPEREDSSVTVGQGVRASVAAQSVLVGDRRFIERAGIAIPAQARDLAERAGRRGASTAFVAHSDRLIGLITYADTPRPETREVLARLRENGVRRLVMVTGDNNAAARHVAAEVGIDEVAAEVFPDQKAEIVRRLQAEGHVVAVIGDGINDSPALAYADVSFSVKAGSDVAQETADIVLHGDLHGLPEAIDLSREAMRLIRQNLAVVAVPNGAGLALASLGLAGPVAATALNNGSTVAAGLNGLRPLLRGRRSAVRG